MKTAAEDTQMMATWTEGLWWGPHWRTPALAKNLEPASIGQPLRHGARGRLAARARMAADATRSRSSEQAPRPVQKETRAAIKQVLLQPDFAAVGPQRW